MFTRRFNTRTPFRLSSVTRSSFPLPHAGSGVLRPQSLFILQTFGTTSSPSSSKSTGTHRVVEDAPLLGPAGFAQTEADIASSPSASSSSSPSSKSSSSPTQPLSREERNKRLEEQLMRRKLQKQQTLSSSSPSTSSESTPSTSASLASFIAQNQTKGASQDQQGSTPPPSASASSETASEENVEGQTKKGSHVNPETGEINGPRGPEPTRYGDFERGGRCFDF